MTTIKVRSQSGCSSITHAGKTYAPDKMGVFEVPSDFAEHAARHGFERVSQKPTLTLRAEKDDAA